MAPGQEELGARGLAPRARTLRVATRCSSLPEFLETFQRFVDDDSIFIVTRQPLRAGVRQAFVIQLRSGETVMQGEGEVLESVGHGEGPFGRSGMRLRLARMDARTTAIHSELLARKQASGGGGAPIASTPHPGALAVAPGALPVAPAAEQRRPGSPITLPANPFSELPEAALEHFIECTLYEETGVFDLVSAADLGATPMQAASWVMPPVTGPFARQTPPAGAATLQGPAVLAPPGASAAGAAAVAFGPAVAAGAAAPPVAPTTPAGPSAVPPWPAAETAPPWPAAETAPRFATPAAPGAFAPPPAFPAGAAAPLDLDLRPRRGAGGLALVLLVGVVAGTAGGTAAGWFLWGRAQGARAAAGVTAGGPSSATAAADAGPGAGAPPGTLRPPPPDAAAVAVAAGPLDAASALPVDAPGPGAPAGGDATGCRATIVTVPDGAVVEVDGRRRGKTPLEDLEVPCGDVRFVLERARYGRVEKTVRVAAGAKVEVVETLARPDGVLHVGSTPAGAAIAVNGAAAGKAPVTVKVTAFTFVNVSATLAGHRPWSQRVYVRKRTLSVQAKLEEIPKPKPPKPRPKPVAPTGATGGAPQPGGASRSAPPSPGR